MPWDKGNDTARKVMGDLKFSDVLYPMTGLSSSSSSGSFDDDPTVRKMIKGLKVSDERYPMAGLSLSSDSSTLGMEDSQFSFSGLEMRLYQKCHNHRMRIHCDRLQVSRRVRGCSAGTGSGVPKEIICDFNSTPQIRLNDKNDHEEGSRSYKNVGGERVGLERKVVTKRKGPISFNNIGSSNSKSDDDDTIDLRSGIMKSSSSASIREVDDNDVAHVDNSDDNEDKNEAISEEEMLSPPLNVAAQGATHVAASLALRTLSTKHDSTISSYMATTMASKAAAAWSESDSEIDLYGEGDTDVKIINSTDKKDEVGPGIQLLDSEPERHSLSLPSPQIPLQPPSMSKAHPDDVIELSSGSDDDDDDDDSSILIIETPPPLPRGNIPNRFKRRCRTDNSNTGENKNASRRDKKARALSSRRIKPSSTETTFTSNSDVIVLD